MLRQLQRPTETTARSGRDWPLLRWGPLVLALLGIVVLWLLVDRHWWALLAGYGPRWIWWPMLLVPLFAGGNRLRTGFATLLTWLVIGWGLLGIRVPAPWRSSGQPPTLSMITFNAAGKASAVAGAIALARRQGAELLVIVECPRSDRHESIPLMGGAFTAMYEVCVWRGDGGPAKIELAPKPIKVVGWSGSIALARLPGMTPSQIGVVHLRSVRNELSEFLDMSEVFGQADSMRLRQEKRIAGSVFGSAWYRGLAPPPEIIAGDFNLVVESAVFRRDWVGTRWHDSFDEAGWGMGHTWRSSWYGLRIDHILHDDTWVASKAKVGPDLGSDHLPLMVELSRSRSTREDSR